jgi:hypothetical protein
VFWLGFACILAPVGLSNSLRFATRSESVEASTVCPPSGPAERFAADFQVTSSYEQTDASFSTLVTS